MEFSVYMAGYNTEPLQGEHKIKDFGVGLYVSGLKHSQYILPDGRELKMPSSPSLRLYLPGMISSYNYNELRENWWVVLREPSPIYYDFAIRKIIWSFNNHTLPLPFAVELAPAEIPIFRKIFSEINSKMQSALPKEHLEAELLLCNVLLRFLSDKNFDTGDDLGVAEKLKRLIDNNDTWNCSIEDLCDHMNVSRDYARRCFFSYYRILPRDYRIQRRVSRIIELLTTTDLSIKEIAELCGISNATYLCGLIRDNCGITPKELRKKYRKIEK